MALDQEKINQILSLVKGLYPDWQDFSHPKYIEDEIGYKQEASDLAHELLNRDALQVYIDGEDSESFIKALERVAQSTNLLYLGAPKTGDLSILYTDGLDKLSLCHTIFDLLHGEGTVDERLLNYLDFVNENEISFKWTFPTYYLFLYYPETEIFIKPEVTRWFLRFVGSEVSYSNQTNIIIYTTYRRYAEEIKDALQDLDPKSMIDIQSIIYISAKIATGQEGGVVSVQKRKEFKRLLDEFVQDYPTTQAGQEHIEFYGVSREQAIKNYSLIIEKNEQGEDITDDVLLKLLPHKDSASNRAQGAWIHVAPVFVEDIKTWHENMGWQKPENWPQVAEQIFRYVQQCLDQPEQLEEACEEFTHSQYSTGFQTSMLTPILNALNPDEFILINNKSRAMYNYFTDENFSQKLIDYPGINSMVKRFFVEVENDILTLDGLPALQTCDLIDMFSHWLKVEKKFDYLGFEELAEPFSEMFDGRDQADWAFDWLGETAGLLGIKGPDDQMAAFTLRYKQGHHLLRLNFGSWLVLEFSGRNSALAEVTLALFEGDYGIDPTHEGEFSQDESEQPIHLYSFAFEQFSSLEYELRLAFREALEYIQQRFKHWNASPHHHRTVPELAQAIFDLDIRDRVLEEGISSEIETEEDGVEGTIRYWKIAPGENAWNWEASRDGGFITIGWEEFGDLSGLDRDGFERRSEELLAQHEDWTEVGLEQVWKFINIQKDDIILANRGTTRVLGIGAVTGGYYYVPGERHGHRLPVNWFDVEEKEVNEGGWRRALIELDKMKYEQITGRKFSEPKGAYNRGVSDRLITPESFALLEELYQNPYKDFYMVNKNRFKRYLFEPFKQFYSQLAMRLPIPAQELLETEKRLFSQIFKNDYGKGGAYDFFWGAFYPKGTSRSGAPQLSIWINKDRLEFGFYIGVYGDEYRKRFKHNCAENFERLQEVLEPSLADDRLIFGAKDTYEVTADGQIDKKVQMSWDEFLQKPDLADYDVTLVVPKEQVLVRSNEEIIDLCLETHTRVFPLVLLATYEEPLAAINEYLEIETETTIEINPEYSLTECSQAIYIDEEQIARWVSAIRRKGQAIFYGPPGTGKTYIAEHLAKHLIGGGTGFDEIVQFHPSYAYEDFMQGIRPKTSDDGKSFTYPLVPGRFVDFCKRAKRCDGNCVLIVDEINRANLSRVFGELMYLLEYRDREIPLAGGGTFRIPKNVILIGTMNTADRSIALVDHALRRRFAFLKLGPNYDILKKYYEDKPFDPIALIKVLERLNQRIGDKNYEVGITFFLLKEGNLADFVEDIWRMEVEPYLEEFFFDQTDNVKEFRWHKVGDEILS